MSQVNASSVSSSRDVTRRSEMTDHDTRRTATNIIDKHDVELVHFSSLTLFSGLRAPQPRTNRKRPRSTGEPARSSRPIGRQKSRGGAPAPSAVRSASQWDASFFVTQRFVDCTARARQTNQSLATAREMSESRAESTHRRRRSRQAWMTDLGDW